MLQEINQNWLTFMNNLLNYKIIEDSVYIFADAPIFFIPLFLVIMWLHFNYKNDINGKNKLLFIFYSTVLAILICLIIQQFVDINRPEEYLKNTGKLILEHIPDASFPSDHAAVSIAFLSSIFLFGFKRLSLIILPFFILMNASRVIAGLHWPFDVIIGTIVGITSAIIIFKLQKNNYIEKLNKFIIKIVGYIKL